jgi:transcriptional regulator with XRE-family HTH domain
VIVVSLWTGQEASALRQALRMTIREFAEHLGVAVRTVAKWEALGLAIVPVPVMQAALDTVLERASDEAKARFSMRLDAAGDSASVSNSAASVDKEDTTKRRAAIKTIGAGLAALAYLDTPGIFEQLTERADRTDRVDGKLVSGHEEVSMVLAGLYRSADPRVVLPVATAYADSVLGLLGRPMTERDHSRLNVVAVGVHAQTGLWACHAGRWASAYRHLATACDIAATASQPSLHAQALGAFSYLFSSAPRGGQGGDPGRALALLDQALDQAVGADGFTRGWLSTWRADQHATRLVMSTPPSPTWRQRTEGWPQPTITPKDSSHVPPMATAWTATSTALVRSRWRSPGAVANLTRRLPTCSPRRRTFVGGFARSDTSPWSARPPASQRVPARP